MATANFVQEGESIDYTPGADVPAGTVVLQGDLVGVAKRTIAANTLGSLAVEGVFEFPRASGGTIAIGTTLYWDNTAGNATTTVGSNKLLSKSVRVSNAGELTIRVKLFQ